MSPHGLVSTLKEKNTLKQATTEVVAQLPQEVQTELKLLRGFRDLTAERMGYFMGRRLTQEELSKATKDERAVASKISTEIREKIPEWIENSDLDTFKAKTKALKDAREVVAKKAKPYRTKMAPLTKAVKYIDNVAIPDALKELGKPVQPRFKLEKWVNEAMETSK